MNNKVKFSIHWPIACLLGLIAFSIVLSSCSGDKTNESRSVEEIQTYKADLIASTSKPTITFPSMSRTGTPI